jgi:nicotinamidase-related amidase
MALEDKTTRLLAHFAENSIDITNAAHLAIDVQRKYCVKKRDISIATHIANNIAPVFNKLKIPTFWVYYENKPWIPDFSLKSELEHADLYKVKPSLGDTLVRKTELSAFKGSDIDDLLKQFNTLVVSGLYFCACVRTTILDARDKDYNVILLKDATDYSSQHWAYDDLVNKNVMFTSSDTLFSVLASNSVNKR